jgi:hypothetical protein
MILTLIALAGLSISMSAQNGQNQGPAVDPRVQQNIWDWAVQQRGVPDDWTHHHLVFSNPGTEQQAIEKGNYEHWLKVVNSRRFTMQQIKRSGGMTAIDGLGRRPGPVSPNPPGNSKNSIKKDWNVPIGGSYASGTGTITSNSATGGQTVTIDSVPLTASAPTEDQGTVTVVNSPAANDTVVIAGTTYTFHSSSTACGSTSNCIIEGGSTTQEAENIVVAINSTGTCGYDGTGDSTCVYNLSPATGNANVSATSSGAVVTLTARQAGTSGLTMACTSTSDASGHHDFGLIGGTTSNTTGCTSTTAVGLSGGGCGSNTGSLFAYQAGTTTCTADTAAQLASSIVAAIAANTTLSNATTGVTAVASTAGGNGPVTNGVVTVTAKTAGATYDYGTTASLTGFTWSGLTMTGGAAAATVQPNMFPAKFATGNSVTSESCSDFVVYPTGTAGSSTVSAPTIVGFSNLYTGTCTTGAVPTVSWAFNTGASSATGSAVTTSPVLSLDGTQVAFIQSNGTTASLVLLKWAASSGTLNTPVAPTLASSATNYRNGTSCSNPCMYKIAFGNGANDTYSAPFYYYDGDIIYVGDDTGKLHQFTGVFSGSPAETTTTWPVNLGTNKLAPPVFDETSGNVFVGDMGGVLHSVTAATGIPYGTTIPLGDAIIDAPLVDSTAKFLYAFVTTGSANPNYFSGDNVVHQFSTGFNGTAVTSASFVYAGAGGAGYYFYAGTFDNVYYTSGTGGNIYVVGNTGATTGAWLNKISISNTNSMAAATYPVTGLTFSGAGAYPWPSPISEFCNGTCTVSGGATTAGTDYVFFSVNRGAVGGCSTTAGYGCVLSYNVSNPASVVISGTGLNVVTPTGTNGCWATGGIVVDNSSTSTGASQTYFVGLNGSAAGGPTATTKTSTNCASTATGSGTIGATQASQSNP